jgi:hypothetical protein
MEETLEGGRGPPRALAPLEREIFAAYLLITANWNMKIQKSLIFIYFK